MAEWKSETLQFESHNLCGPVQLGLVVVISGGGASVRGGLASCGGALPSQEVGFSYLVPDCRGLPEVVLPVEERLGRGLTGARLP